MYLFGKVFAAIAQHVLRKGYEDLRAELRREYAEYLGGRQRSPSHMLKRLLISGEDHRFFRHNGVDLIAVGRAVWRRLTQGTREGASTIEMQTVRILTGRYERTVQRKTREILLATLVTQVIPKEDLPGVYLQIGYFGWRMNGLEQACRRLGLSLDTITLQQSAALIARLKYPEPQVAPITRSRQIVRRRDHLVALYWKHLEQGVYSPLDKGFAYEAVRSV